MRDLRKAVAAATVLTLLLLVPEAEASISPAYETEFAQILKLEDRRSSGDGRLLGYLEQAQPLQVRVRAALAAGRIGTPVTTPYHLLAAIQDPAPELRRMAAFALGEMDDIKAAPLLALALDDSDAQVRVRAAEALGKLKDPASVSLLAARLSDPDASVIGMTLLALWKIDAGAALPDIVARAAGIYAGATGELRRQAAYFLMRAQMVHPEDESIRTALLVVARDPDPLIRSYAARGLGASVKDPSTQALLGLAGDTDWRVRVNSFNGLRARPVPRAVCSGESWKTYETGLKSEDTGVALAALAALESCDAPEARERLAAALGHPKVRFREVALLALAAREKQAALLLILPLASDSQWSIRARLAEALGLIGSQEVSVDLTRLAADPDPRVRSVAIESLGKMRSESASGAISSALADTDLFVRAAALESIGSQAAALAADANRQAAIAALAGGYRRALADQQNDARLAALSALAKVGSDPARAEMEKALEDPDYLVRRRSAELLRETFRLDRLFKVGEAPASRSDSEYLEVARRAGRRVTATFETEAGSIVVELFPEDAPLTVDNFMRLAGAGKLDGLAFHRVVPNFVIQDGDPRGDGNGGPAWQIRCEINLRRYGEGTVGMALSGKDTGGSQYFMTHSPQPHLDGGYTVFGEVISGQQIVNRRVQGDRILRVTTQEFTRIGYQVIPHCP